MASGTVRKRSWVTSTGEIKTAWVADYFDQHRTRHKRQFPTKKAAGAWLLQTRVEVRDGIHTPAAGSITVAEAGRLWLERCERDGLERGTWRNYDAHLRCHIAPSSIGGMRLSELTPPAIETFKDELLEQGRSRERVRTVLSSLGSILKEAQRLGLVVYNAATATRIVVRRREEERLEIGRGIPSKADVAAILAAAPQRWRPLFVTAAYTGMRASELRALAWDAVDLARGKEVIHVRRRADLWGAIGPTKSAASRRDIPLAAAVVSALREWRVAYPYGPNGIVFCSWFRRTRAEAASHSLIAQVFHKAQVRAGIVDGDGRAKYRFHALRHFFASAGIEAGFQPKRLQALLGHASITMTFDTYGHLFPNPEDDYARLDRIEQAVSATLRT